MVLHILIIIMFLMLYSFFLSTGIVDRFLIYSYGLYKLGMFDTAGGDFWL